MSDAICPKCQCLIKTLVTVPHTDSECRDALTADLARVTAELAEARSERQREHDLRVKIAGDLEGTQEAFRRSDDKRAAAEADRDRAMEALRLVGDILASALDEHDCHWGPRIGGPHWSVQARALLRTQSETGAKP